MKNCLYFFQEAMKVKDINIGELEQYHLDIGSKNKPPKNN